MSFATLLIIIIVGLLCMALPFAAMAVLRRRFGMSLRWRVAAIGALTFFVSQIVLRLPWQIPLNQLAVQNGWTSGVPFLLFGLGAAITAGFFEETGRYFAYRWFVKRPAKDDAIALGLGHGGIESALLVGVSSISTGVMLYLFANGGWNVPAEQAAALQPLLDRFAGTGWSLQLVVLLERMSAVTAHVAMSVLVYTAYVRRRWMPYFAALAVHVAIDATAAVLAGRLLVQESIILLVGIVCLWGMIRWWRRADG
ncbi:YhfC family intramembrane metalloprotease [Paenibacillus chartarius]|uniref:YhfC family intramembrane metalloprotease n=1 Tax=Paenibacillus chartarius TaxID=747481 RepID=A0ABV6DM37_9BACL